MQIEIKGDEGKGEKELEKEKESAIVVFLQIIHNQFWNRSNVVDLETLRMEDKLKKKKYREKKNRTRHIFCK